MLHLVCLRNPGLLRVSLRLTGVQLLLNRFIWKNILVETPDSWFRFSRLRATERWKFKADLSFRSAVR